MIEIIKHRNEWQNILHEVDSYDFYHTYDYHYTSKKENETQILIVYKDSHVLIALPLLIRPIFDTNNYDATSVYGYSGPVSKNVHSNFDNTNFINELNLFFVNQNIISVFSRLNPFIKNQNIILKGLGEINHLSQVVNIDITKDLDLQRACYSKSTKNRINKVKKIASVKISNSEKDISEFIKIYYENMKRVNAEDYYFFDKNYFHQLISSDNFDTEFLFVTLNETNEIICGAMMIKANNIVQYHLSGTKNDYINVSPVRVLIDAMRIKATNDNFKYFNLGGGLGNKEDALFDFKSSFSKDFKPFQVWKHIINKEKYDLLVEEKNIITKTNFFPKYRYINN